MSAPDTSMPIVTADHVSKWYGQVIGLNDVSVNVPPGVTGLLGPNGAGKSTFMKLITGQLKPSKGAVTVLGEPIWGNPKLYFQIGFCPEQDAFYERMTGLEWVTGARAAQRARREGRRRGGAAARSTAVDLMDAAGKKIGAYSKGMRQRVKLAQAIVHDPGAAHPRRAALGHGSARAPAHHPPDSRLGAAPASPSSSRATSCTRSSR